MFSFLKISLYRKKLIVYFCVMLAISILIGALLANTILSSQIMALNQDAQRAFERVESELEKKKGEAEYFIQGIYGDKRLLSDMMQFIGNSCESYLSARLRGAVMGIAAPSLVSAVDEFALVNGSSVYHKISFHSQNTAKANVIYFDTANRDIHFMVDNGSFIFEGDTRESIVFERNLASAENPRESIGYARFAMGTDWLLSLVRQYNLSGAAVADKSGHLLALGVMDEGRQEILRRIVASGQNQGWESGLYYTVFTSAQNEYLLVTAYDTPYVFSSVQDMLLIVFIGIAALYFTLILLVCINMRHEAEFLTSMLGNINKMERGLFEPMANKYGLKNEYGIIANALNRMGVKLERHIRTNYLLKISQQEAEMLAMQRQINPHFLYNTLEIIRSSATLANADEAADSIASLGRMYRDMVSGAMDVNIAQETEYLTAYLEIMELRHRGVFCYQTEVDECVQLCRTIKFWMQPIAENFFRHGFDKDSEYNMFVMTAKKGERGISVRFVDNGAGIPEDQLASINQSLQEKPDLNAEKSVGLRNVYARLKYRYGDALEMRLENNEEAGITVYVEIPCGGVDDV
ncbi:MAG: histidine kinase [Oscillospiraceae bacterium]|nr:histidine kinase [Oscillospiraceae bacterium]